MQNSVESYWAKNANKYDEGKKGSIEKIIDRISDLINSSSTVLDIATGTGIAAIKLANYAQHVDAIDNESNMLAVAQKKINANKINNITLHKQSAYELKFPRSFFDFVVILNSLHVMETPHIALNEVKRVLKSTGMLFAPTFCHAESKEVLSNYKEWSRKSGHKSYHLFTCETLCDLICRCGFSVQTNETLYINQGEDIGTLAIGYVVAIPEN